MSSPTEESYHSDDNNDNDESLGSRHPPSDEEDGSNSSEEEDVESVVGNALEKGDGDDAASALPSSAPNNETTTTKTTKSKKVHKLSLSQTEDFNAKLAKRGVVYVARVPPKMTPTKVKALLSEYGEVTRVYLVEEDAAVRKRRRKLSGGNGGGKRYVEGWVEFAHKTIAQHVATSLNTTPISNVKRDPHCGDLWALKYLRKFQWSHLTEKVAYERRVREQKMRLETMQARRETVAYRQLVETGKKLDKIEARKRRRIEREGPRHDESVQDKELKKKQQHRRPPQLKPIDTDGPSAAKKPLLGALV